MTQLDIQSGTLKKPTRTLLWWKSLKREIYRSVVYCRKNSVTAAQIESVIIGSRQFSELPKCVQLVRLLYGLHFMEVWHIAAKIQ